MFMAMQIPPEDHRLGVTMARHEFIGFMEGLSKEQLNTFGSFLNEMLSETGPQSAALWMGVLWQIQKKHGACGCGVDHETVEEMLGVGDKKSNPSEPKIVDHPFTSYSGMACNTLVTARDEEDGFEYGTECGQPSSAHVLARGPARPEPGKPISTQETASDYLLEASAEDRRQILAKKYNVSFSPYHVLPEVTCNGCGLQYPSLRDRMLKGPDDCHGCHLKSSNG